MSKKSKLLKKLMDVNQSKNMTFDELRVLLSYLGFELVRVEGSHHQYLKEGIPNLVNIQKTGNLSKGYQRKQIREIIKTYGLE